MRGAPIRAYADTSVFGGVVDPEFSEASRRFLEHVREGRVSLAISGLVQEEIQEGPEPVRAALDDMLSYAELVEIEHDAYALHVAYVKYEVVTERWAADALHVATASVSRCAMIVSWNFRHIVNFRRIPLYNAVNALMGYPPMAIHSPPEVRFDEEEL